MNEPCKANKCILYPICINKEEIYCDDLNEYILTVSGYSYDKNKERTPLAAINITKELWDTLNKILPNVITIRFKNFSFIRRSRKELSYD